MAIKKSETETETEFVNGRRNEEKPIEPLLAFDFYERVRGAERGSQIIGDL